MERIDPLQEMERILAEELSKAIDKSILADLFKLGPNFKSNLKRLKKKIGKKYEI